MPYPRGKKRPKSYRQKMRKSMLSFYRNKTKSKSARQRISSSLKKYAGQLPDTTERIPKPKRGYLKGQKIDTGRILK
ncbi:hypothetical protein J4433_00120 [Candidatus Pacearchaeota archaeon]|nr:hypothetical protein [Candidatus Pacearchaeota archaeon]